MNRTRWIIFAAVCVALLGLLVFTNKPSTATFKGDPAEVTKQDNVFGNRDAKVVLIEYGDFQCPGCGALFPVLKEVKSDYKENVAFAYRYLPLTNIHPNAKAAAAAAAAAGNQGKFWAMHDKLYERQSEWSNASANTRSDYFKSYAKGIGLDMKQYETDVHSDAVSNRVARGRAAAQKAGLQLGTPILVLNGEELDLKKIQVDGRYNADKLRQVLNQALKEAGVELPESTPSKEEKTT